MEGKRLVDHIRQAHGALMAQDAPVAAPAGHRDHDEAEELAEHEAPWSAAHDEEGTDE